MEALTGIAIVILLLLVMLIGLMMRSVMMRSGAGYHRGSKLNVLPGLNGIEYYQRKISFPRRWR